MNREVAFQSRLQNGGKALFNLSPTLGLLRRKDKPPRIPCWALLLWSFVPDGPVRSVIFFWASTAWVLTILVNANPLMRFDGYYMAADALDQPNLQDVSFLVARWHLRRVLLGANEAQPLSCSAVRRCVLIGFGYATWIYRFLLFLGIAVVLYLMSFKLLGMFLAVVEIAWFIVRPVWREMRHWWTQRAEIGMNPTLLRTVVILAAILVAALVPWRSTVHADAIVAVERRTVVFAPAAARMDALQVSPGQRVREGDVLVRLASPDLEHEAAQIRRSIETLVWQIGIAGQQQEFAARASLLAHERQTRLIQLASVEASIMQLVLHAPFDGQVVEVADPIRTGEWVRRGEPLVRVADRSGLVIEAFVPEQELRRFSAGATAWIVFRNPDLSPIPAIVEEVDQLATMEVPEAALSSTHGGPIPARADQHGIMIPELPIYRVRLHPQKRVDIDRVELAHVLIRGKPESLAASFARTAWGTLIRESGF